MTSIRALGRVVGRERPAHQLHAPIDSFPLLVRVQKTGKLKHDTDLLIDQIRAISARRLMYCYCTLGANHLK